MEKSEIIKKLMMLNEVKFIDVYIKLCNVLNCYFGGDAIATGILGTQTSTILPNISEAIKIALMPNANLTDIRFNETWFLDFLTWKLSPTFKNVILSKMEENGYESTDDLNDTDLTKIFQTMFGHLEEEFGISLLRMAKSLMSYDPDKALMNRYEKETWTPEVEETVTNKDNFKTTTTSKFKTETDEDVYGFNSAAAVPAGKTTSSGLATDNENVVSGNENDNNSEMTRSYDGSDVTEKEGFMHDVQDSVIKEIELRKLEFVNLLKDAIRKEFFLI